MRILLAWVFFGGLAAVSHFVVAPATAVSGASATEPSQFVALFYGTIGFEIFNWILPVALLAAAAGFTVWSLGRFLVRS